VNCAQLYDGAICNTATACSRRKARARCLRFDFYPSFWYSVRSRLSRYSGPRLATRCASSWGVNRKMAWLASRADRRLRS